MIPHQFFYLMVVLGLLWIFFLLPVAWPSRCIATHQRPEEPILPSRQRSNEPNPFAGFTHQPPCAACEQEAAHPPPPPPEPPAPMPFPKRRPRQGV